MWNRFKYLLLIFVFVAAGVLVYFASATVTRGPMAMIALMTVGFFIIVLAILTLIEIFGRKELDPSDFQGGYGSQTGKFQSAKTGSVKLPSQNIFTRQEKDE